MMNNKKISFMLSSVLALSASIGMSQTQAKDGLQQVTTSAKSDYAKTQYPIVLPTVCLVLPDWDLMHLV